MKAERILILSLLAIALVACTQPSAFAPTQAPPLPTSAPVVSPAAATNAAQATTAPTSAPTPTRLAPTATQAPAASALPGGDLSEADMAKLFRASFAAYPWRWKQSGTVKATQETVTGLIEAQSSTRVHVISNQTIDANNIMIESILITPTLYMKATGAPPDVLRQFGATEGQWLKVPPSSPLADFAQLAYLIANPAKLLVTIGFHDLLKQADPNAKPYKLVGTESVGSALTNVYEAKVGSGDLVVTYRTSVGSSDGRIYKMVSDSALLITTTTVEYDSSINIQPPIP